MYRNKNGGAYVRFELVREAGQAAVDLGRPDRREREVWERLRGGD